MRVVILLLLAVAGLLGGERAFGQALRYPEIGEPAFTLQMPEGWARRSGPPGLLILSSPEGSAKASIVVGRDNGSFDEIAQGVAKDINGLLSIERTDDLVVAGKPAASYKLSVLGAGAELFEIKLILVRIDSLWSANFSLVFNTRATADLRTQALSIPQSAALAGE